MRTTILIALLLATPAAAQPSQNPRVGQLAEVAFDRGSAELPIRQIEKIQRKLGRVAAWAIENPEGFVIVNGHADREGTRAANVRLSLARARMVRDTLVAAGVSPDQIVITPYGEAGAKRSVVIWGTRTDRPTQVTFR